MADNPTLELVTSVLEPVDKNDIAAVHLLYRQFSLCVAKVRITGISLGEIRGCH